jgi:hypothetical protein
VRRHSIQLRLQRAALFGEVGVEEAKRVGRGDNADALAALLVGDLAMKFVHLGPVHLGAEMGLTKSTTI